MNDLQRQAVKLGQRPALILVDMFRGFTDPECSLGCECTAMQQSLASLLQLFRQRQWPRFFSLVVYDHVDQARVFRQRLPVLDQLQRGSPWLEFRQPLVPGDGEIVIEKHWASAFFATDLNQQLQREAVDSLVVTGLTTSGCVRATALDGLQHDYPVWIPEECVADRNPAAHRANLHDLHAKYAEVTPLAQLSEQLASIAEVTS